MLAAITNTRTHDNFNDTRTPDARHLHCRQQVKVNYYSFTTEVITAQDQITRHTHKQLHTALLYIVHLYDYIK